MVSITFEILGTGATVKVIDYILENRDVDYSIGDVAEGSGVSRMQVHRIWHNLLAHGIIKKTRKISKIQLYSLVKDHIVSKGLMKMYNSLLSYQVERVESEG